VVHFDSGLRECTDMLDLYVQEHRELRGAWIRLLAPEGVKGAAAALQRRRPLVLDLGVGDVVRLTWISGRPWTSLWIALWRLRTLQRCQRLPRIPKNPYRGRVSRKSSILEAPRRSA